MRRLLEAMDSMSRAEKNPTGPKFPGYWKGTDPASAAKNKMVGGAEESVMPELAKTAKKKSTEWDLEQAYEQFKEDYRRDVVPKPAGSVDTTLPQGYGTPLGKIPPPTGDQSGGFKKVQPGEKFDPGSEQPIDLGPVTDPDIRKMTPAEVNKALKEPFKLPAVSAKVPAEPKSDTSMPVPLTGVDRTPKLGLKPPSPYTSLKPGGQGVNPPSDITNWPPTVDSSSGEVSPQPNTKQYIHRPDEFIKDPSGEWQLNPKYSTDISPEEHEEINRQIQQQKMDEEDAPIDQSLDDNETSVAPSDDRVPNQSSNAPRSQQQRTGYPQRQPTILPTKDADQAAPVDASYSNIPTRKLDPFSNASKDQQLQNISRRGQSTVNIGSDNNRGGQVQPQSAVSTDNRDKPPAAKPGSWQELAQLNKITDPTKLQAGKAIKLPDGTSYMVVQGDTLSDIAQAIRRGQMGGTPVTQTTPSKSDSSVSTTRPIAPVAVPKGQAARTTPAEPSSSQSAVKNVAPPAPVDNSQPPVSRGIRSPEQRAKDQADLAAAEKAEKQKQDRLKVQMQDAPSRHPLQPSINVPQPTPTPATTPAPKTQSTPDIHSQAGQDAQWEKDKQMMQGWWQNRPTWLGGSGQQSTAPKTSASPATTSQNDAIRQADIAALQREISRTPASAKTRLGILNKELADRQQVTSTNESLSQRLSKEFEQFLESDEPYKGYDQDVEKLKQRAKLGPMKTVWDEKTQRYRVVPVKPQEKQIKEYGNAQDATQQTTNANQQQTSQTGNQQALDQQVDIATAKSTMSGLKSAIGPQLNTNAAASGIAKMNDGQPLSVPEREAISTLTPLVAKAAETPATATALKSALSTANMLAKQGK